MNIPVITGIIRRRILLNYRVAPEALRRILPANFQPKLVHGYSSRPDSRTLDGLLLKVPEWKVAPLNIRSVRSAYFDDPALFPPGQIEFDHALLMRDIRHEWHSEPAMTVMQATSLP